MNPWHCRARVEPPIGARVEWMYDNPNQIFAGVYHGGGVWRRAGSGITTDPEPQWWRLHSPTLSCVAEGGWAFRRAA